MKKFTRIILLMICMVMIINVLFSQNAGVTSIGSKTTCPNTIIVLPLNLKGGTLITGISIDIYYDAAVLSAIQTGNTSQFLLNLNSVLSPVSSWNFAQTNKSVSEKQIKLAWSTAALALQLDTDSLGVAHLCDIKFRYLGGNTVLNFDNSTAYSGMCEYDDSLGDPLNDVPTASYYVPGNVTEGPAPGQPGLISGNTDPCVGTSAYSVTSSAGVTYIWSNTAGYTGSSTTSSITLTFLSTATPGIISVVGTNTCGTGPASSLVILSIKVPSIQATSITSTADTICPLGSVTLGISGGTLGSGADWYWYKGSCAGALVGNGAGYGTTPAVTDTFYVRAEGICNSTSCVNKIIVVRPTPVQPDTIIGNVTPVPGTYQVYSVINVQGITYTWTAPSGWSGSSASGSITYLIGTGQGSISVIASNICGTSIARTLNVSTYSISGYFTYDNITIPVMDSVWVFLLKNGAKIDSTRTDLSGYYIFQWIGTGTYTINAKTQKDWGGVNSTDAVKVKRHFAGSELFTSSLRLHGADVNMSFGINATDAVKITRRFVGSDTTFARGDWTFEEPFGGDTLNVSDQLNDTVKLTSNSIVQNFKALCVGDVNGSNVPGVGAKAISKVSLNNDDVLNLSANEDFEIPFRNSEPVDLSALSLIFDYPKDKVTISSVLMPAASMESNLFYHAKGDELRIGWFESDHTLAFDNNSTVIIIHGRTTAAFKPGDKITFTVQNNPLCEFADENGESIESATLLGSTIEYANPGGIQSLNNSIGNNMSVYPNPAIDNLNISYSVRKNSKVNIQLFNVLGENINEIVNSQVPKGSYSKDINLNSLSEGVYTLKMTIEGSSTIIKRIVVSR